MTKREIRAIRLLEMLQISKRLEIKAVADTLQVSEATTRRLFAQLEKQGKVIRVHGGVQLAPQLGYDYSYRISAMHRSEQKTRIGNAAAELVKNNERIFLDSGTTVLKLANALSMKIQTGLLSNLVVLTNSLTHIETLARWCKVILIGGEIRVERKDVCGSIAEKTLSLFHLDRAFLGADAINLESGFMSTDERTSKMNEIVMQRTDRALILADSEKFGKSSFITYAALSDAYTIYTDSGAGRSLIEPFIRAGATIEVVED